MKIVWSNDNTDLINSEAAVPAKIILSNSNFLIPSLNSLIEGTHSDIPADGIKTASWVA